MKIAQYVLLGVTSSLLVAFIAMGVFYFVKGRKGKDKSNRKLEVAIYIDAVLLFIASIAFTVINVVASI